MVDMTTSLAQRLSAVLKVSGLSRSEFSEKLGISERTLKNYENEVTEMSAGILKTLYREYSINIHWLLLGQGSMDAATLDEIVEAAVSTTRRFFEVRDLTVDPGDEAKIVRYLVRQVHDTGAMSEPAEKSFFKTILTFLKI